MYWILLIFYDNNNHNNNHNNYNNNNKIWRHLYVTLTCTCTWLITDFELCGIECKLLDANILEKVKNYNYILLRIWPHNGFFYMDREYPLRLKLKQQFFNIGVFQSVSSQYQYLYFLTLLFINHKLEVNLQGKWVFFNA